MTTSPVAGNLTSLNTFLSWWFWFQPTFCRCSGSQTIIPDLVEGPWNENNTDLFQREKPAGVLKSSPWTIIWPNSFGFSPKKLLLKFQTWHSIWHPCWHSIWHFIWHSTVPDILSGILSDIYSDIYSDMSCGILSDVRSDMLSGSWAGIPTYIAWHFIWRSFWHSTWHIYSDIIWHSIWHSVCIFWHFIWHSFWRSIWHLFWHSIRHSIWHIFWNVMWHSVWRSIWHAFWYLSWHSNLHVVWHFIWHSCWHSIWHNPDILSGILSDLLCIPTSYLSFFLASVWVRACRVRVCPNWTDWTGAHHELLERDCSTWAGDATLGAHSDHQLARGEERRSKEGTKQGVAPCCTFDQI